MKKIILCLPIIGMALSCAKTRPTERVPDINENRFEKAPLVNSDTWFVKETIVASDTLGGFGFVGLQSSVVAGKFEFSKDKLKFIRAASFDANKDTLDSVIYSWDVEHSEYRLSESGGKVSNRQEENNYLEWNKKRYFKADLSEADLTLMDTTGKDSCFDNVTKSIVPESQSIKTDRMSFEVDYTYRLKDECWLNYIQRALSEQTTHTVRVRYSFIPAPVNSDYTPYRYTDDTDPLFDKYGYFTTVVEAKKEDNRLENVFLMNRWNPNKTHTIYFAPGFPEQHKWLYNHPEFGVMARTNEILAKHDIKMRFKIEDAPAGVVFGDLGYSFVKFVDEASAGSPLGYGPSDPNPFTGEFLGSNSIIWTSSLKFYVERIKAAVESADARENQSASDLYSKIADIFGENTGPEQWTDTAATLATVKRGDKAEFATDAGRVFHLLLPKYTYAPYSLYSLPAGMESPEVKVANDILKKLNKYNEISPTIGDPSLFQTTSAATFDLDQRRYQNYYQDRFEVDAALSHLKSVTETVVSIQQEKLRQRLTKKAANANTIHYLDESQQGLGDADINGMTAEQIIDAILYRVAIHEFGHNLSLRHNFMGSVDGVNFHPDHDLTDREGNIIVGADGKPVRSKVSSSSVMDYQDLVDEIRETFVWGKYDEAALAFAYTGGKLDLAKENNTLYLYCTDEHRSLNAMCNVYDRGTTPSEVALSLIENYDDSYAVANKRFGRAYWDSFNYANSRFSTMMQLRKFLPFAFQTFDSTMDTELSKLNFDTAKRDEIRRDIKNDLYQAGLLVAAFYHAVIQQSKAERPFLDDVTKNGSLRTIGIGPDKLYAAYFLFAAPEIQYSVKSYSYPYSFLGLRNVSNVFEKILKVNLKNQPDAYQGFINFGRMLYAETVTNYLYSSDYELRSRSDIKCLSADSMKTYFKPELSAFPVFDPDNNIRVDEAGNQVTSRLKAVNLVSERKDQVLSDKGLATKFFGQKASIAIVEFAGNYLITSSADNPYTFDMLTPIAADWSSGYAVEAEASYIFEYYRYLRQLEGRLVLDRCNDSIE
jgi:hypothetical protein